MVYFHAVFVDETGCEFGAGCHANSHEEAEEILSENYPESRIVQLESPNDTAAREAETYARVLRELDDDYDYEDDY
jgi:hypothetical protein